MAREKNSNEKVEKAWRECSDKLVPAYGTQVVKENWRGWRAGASQIKTTDEGQARLLESAIVLANVCQYTNQVSSAKAS